ncbi:MAG: hypothetical protein M0R46_14940 [Candidatus Muirbacterium halophilum]|nr:hypothetical protein [Candidatus Muirbacterium halophilum]
MNEKKLPKFIISNNCIWAILKNILNIKVNNRKNAIGKNILFGSTAKKLAKIYKNNPSKKVNKDNEFSAVERYISVFLVKKNEKKFNINENIPDIMNITIKKNAYFFMNNFALFAGNIFAIKNNNDVQNIPSNEYLIK